MKMFKVCRLTRTGAPCSAVVKGSSAIEYPLNEEVKSPYTESGYGILVFEDYQSALYFLHINSLENCRIYTADCKQEMILPYRYIGEDIGTFLASVVKRPVVPPRVAVESYAMWPHGTRMFKYVTLTGEADEARE